VIRSLEDARRWCEAVSNLVGMMDRVARRYLREELGKQTLEETLHRDDKIRSAATIRDLAKRVTEDLDDLAVLLLFSVFEATVRERTLEEMDRELEKPHGTSCSRRLWAMQGILSNMGVSVALPNPTRISILSSEPWLTR